MSADLGVVKGVIELQDEFTSKVGLAEIALSKFSAENQESLKAIAGAAALVTAAFVAIGVAAIELGTRGADVEDVEETLKHFAGSAREADAVMSELQRGTKGTVDSFLLAKDAAHLMSAGVKLSSGEFGTLADAAFVLSNRGLGSVQEMMTMVSDAMVTGKTKALAMKIGVVDAGDAEEELAKKLGVTVAQLSDSGKAEAKRIQIMGMLKGAVKDAGDQELDFADKVQQGKVSLQNWLDEVAKGVAASPVLAAGLDAAGRAFQAVFGGDNQDAVQTIVKFIDSAAIKVVDFGLGMVEVARVVHVAWALIETIILAVETAIVGIVTAIVAVVSGVAAVGEKLGIISKETAQSVNETRDQLTEMTKSLAAQTAEAAKGIVGASEFDKTLDKLGGTLFQVRDGMVAAQTGTKALAEEQTIAANNAKILAGVNTQLTASLVDQGKVAEALKKSTAELDGIWADYALQVSKHTTNSRDEQIAAIQAVFDKQVAALDDADPLYKEKYGAYAKIAKESLQDITLDWDTLKTKSLETLQAQADQALATYNMMVLNANKYTREVMEEQRQKYQTLADAARGWGRSTESDIKGVVDEIKLLDHAWVTNADIAAATMSKTTVMVKTLSGEVISLLEAQKRQQSGGSFTYDLTTQSGVNQYRQMNQGMDIAWSDSQLMEFAKKGGTLQQLMQMGVIHMKKFASGGVVTSDDMVMVGERGPEAVQLPVGSRVYPTGTPVGGSNSVQLTIEAGAIVMQYPFMPDARARQEVAKSLGQEIMRVFVNRGNRVPLGT
jgi:hypothetical protein